MLGGMNNEDNEKEDEDDDVVKSKKQGYHSWQKETAVVIKT
jgi:hypothetical protein